MTMRSLVFNTQPEATEWVARIDTANGWTAPETWDVPRQLLDGRWGIADPYGDQFISPFGTGVFMAALTQDDFPQLEDI